MSAADDIRRWLELQKAKDKRRRQAEARSTSGEWSIAADAKPTSHEAHMEVSAFLGRIRLEWHIADRMREGR